MSVHNQYGKLKSVLLCEPVHFSLQPINVIAERFLRENYLPDQARVINEHKGFSEAFIDAGVDIIWADPDPAFPYQVFTRDIGVTTKEGVILGSFREKIRQGEEQQAKNALDGHVPIWKQIESGNKVAFEGGDFMYIDEEHVAVGIGARTTKAGVEQLRSFEEKLGKEIIPVPFDPQFLHLDMIFCVLSERVCTICPNALPENFVKRIRNCGFEMIEVPEEGVFNLECNLLALDKDTIISPARNTQVNNKLKALGFKLAEVELEELLKGGGGPHCMSFPIDRA
jgi:N-dimethylarginine dimethylaminohydrolase